MAKTTTRRAKGPKPAVTVQQDPVFQGIFRAIAQKRIRPGTKLGEDLLADIFGTNRMHVRQVLAHLAYRNVVTLLPNRGAFVSRPDVEEARQVFRARRAIEAATVAAALRGMTPDGLERLRGHGRVEAEAAPDDRWLTLTLAGDFHVLVAELSGNAVLVKFLEELVSRTALIIAEYEQPGVPDCAAEAHAQLVELMAAGDEPAAVAAMDRHLVEVEARLRLDAVEAGEPDLRAILAPLDLRRSA